MNGKKWVIAAMITVCVLALVAMILGTVLVVKLVKTLNYSDGYEIREEINLDDIFERHESVEEPPMAPEGEAPAVIAEQVELDGPLGILVFNEDDNNMRILEAFDQTCSDHGIETVLFVGNGDPLVIRDAAISMLENDGIAGIAASTADPAITEELVDIAAEFNVPVFSIDAAMDADRPNGVIAHIDSWGSNNDIAFEVLMNVVDMAGSKCKFGVVEPFDDGIFAEELRWQCDMHTEFQKLDLVVSSGGDGTDVSCQEAITQMLEEYDLDALICSEPQTTMAALVVMEELGMDIPIIGFAPPSIVADFGNSNIVTIWRDPKTTGELAARCLIGLLTGEVVFEEGALVDVRNGDSYRMEEVDGVLTMWVNVLRITQDNADALRDRE